MTEIARQTEKLQSRARARPVKSRSRWNGETLMLKSEQKRRQRIASKKYRESHPEKIRKYKLEHQEKLRKASRKYYATHRKERHAHVKEWKTRNPLKLHAHRILQKAVSIGLVIKRRCEFPPPHSTGQIHGHHDDYSKPLKVRWVCALHHSKIHKQLTAKG